MMQRPQVTRLPAGQASANDARAKEFAAQFTASFRVLWLIGVGIIGDADLAEDVVQEAAIIAYSKFDQFSPGTNFSGWAGQIVRNVALNRARTERRRRTKPVEPELLDAVPGQAAESPISPMDRSTGLGIDQRVLHALGNVGDTARACLLLRTLEGMEYSQIARLMEIPEGTAMSHVHRARSYLRERLAGVWAEKMADRQARV